jgi:hypothetical protein
MYISLQACKNNLPMNIEEINGKKTCFFPCGKYNSIRFGFLFDHFLHNQHGARAFLTSQNFRILLSLNLVHSKESFP